MPESSLEYLNSEYNSYLQDDAAEEQVSAGGEPLAHDFSPFTLQKIYAKEYGLRFALGEQGARRGHPKFNGEDIQLSGKIYTSGTAVIGDGNCKFTTELNISEAIRGEDGEFRTIQSIADDNHLSLYKPFTQEIPSGTPQDCWRSQTLAERLANFKGGGGGTGKNYIQNPDLETDLTGWTNAASGNLVVTRTSVGGEILAGTASAKITAGPSSAQDVDFITVDVVAIDPEDINQLFEFELSFRSITNFNSGDAYVVIRDLDNSVSLTPNPNLIPAGVGKLRGYFTTSDSLNYEIRIFAGKNGAMEFAVDSIRMGPAISTLGPSLSGWQEYPLSITATSSSPGKAGSPVADKAYWRRVGDSMEIQYTYYHTSAGSAGNGIYLFSLPAGYTIDSGRMDFGTLRGRGVCGSATAYSVGSSQAAGFVQAYNATNLAILGVTDSVGTDFVSNTLHHLGNASILYSFRAVVPIAQWTLGTSSSFNRLEYAHNSSSINADDETSFAYGESGSLIPPVSGTLKRYRLKFSRPFKHYRLEVRPGGTGPWLSAGDAGFDFWEYSGTGIVGMALEKINDREMYLKFSHNGRYGPTGLVSWPAENGLQTRWRVAAADNPLFVETAPREYLAATSAAKTPAGNGHWHLHTGNSVILPPGEWLLTGSVEFYNSGTPAWTLAEIKWGAANGADTSSEPTAPTVLAGLEKHRFYLFTGSDINRFPAPTIRIRTTAATTIYLNSFGELNTVASGRVKTHIYAERMS